MDTVNTWSAQIFIGDHDEHTTAEVRLRTRDTSDLRGTGRARRSPGDLPITEIGEEIAVARAFIDLGHRLLDSAASDIEAITHDVPRLRPDEGRHDG